ncbi:hypothetical protein ACFSW8_12525 [Rubritalea tangerina]|uniref:FecR protein domain-containing protein n=2 Tax=Rubritalea tangerina TaxID=430798 RepID=A0ABW4ZCY5_9BACT
MNASTLQQLDLLIDKILSPQSLTNAECRELENLLATPSARVHYLRAMQQEQALYSCVETQPELVTAKPSPLIRFAVPLSLAAAAAIAFTLYVQHKHTPDGPIIAAQQAPNNFTILSSRNVEWNGPSPKGSDTQTVNILSGHLKLRHPSGAEVIVQGPAHYQSTGPNSGNISKGKCSVLITPQATGYTLDYPEGRIVDLGTQFGVEVKPGELTKLGVFQGSVELQAANTTQTLNTGEALLHDFDTGIQSTSISSIDIHRTLPSKTYLWSHHTGDPTSKTFDITDQINQAGTHTIALRKLDDTSSIGIAAVHLLKDGAIVDSDTHSGRLGKAVYTRKNTYQVTVPDAINDPAEWSVQVDFTPRNHNKPTRGDLLVVSPTMPKASDYLGKWVNHFRDRRHVWEFRPDGSATISSETDTPGQVAQFDARYSVDGSIITFKVTSEASAFKMIIDKESNEIFMLNRQAEPLTRMFE